MVISGDKNAQSNTVCVSLTQKAAPRREQAISDLIESVALQEAALARILNAEGKKIQTMAAMDNISFNELMCLNNSATSLLSSVAQLEMIFQSKLFKTRD